MRDFILSAMVLSATLSAAAQNPQIQINKDNRTISITASDTADETATIARVHVGFIVYGPDEQSTYATGSQRSNAIAKALADAGVPKDSIQSENQNLNPVPVYENNQVPKPDQANRKYQLSQSWTVKVGAESAANILHVAVLAGANNSGGIDWDVADNDELQAKAAAKALASARNVAQSMAAGLGVKLGPLVYATNQLPEGNGPRPFMAMAKRQVVAPAPLAISPQKVEKSATVTAVFAIE